MLTDGDAQIAFTTIEASEGEYVTATATRQDATATPDTNTSEFSGAVLVADLSIEKEAPERVTDEQKFTYRLTLTNQGPSAAEDVTVTDRIPEDVRFVSASQGCQIRSGTVSCQMASLSSESGQNRVSFKIRVIRNPGKGFPLPGFRMKAKAEGTKTNTASVDSETSDPNTRNDTDTATTRVSAANAASVAEDDRYVMNEDRALAPRRPGILINDSDPDENIVACGPARLLLRSPG